MTQKEVSTRKNNTQLISSDRRLMMSIAAGRDINCEGEEAKTQLVTRIKKSKFTKIISGMTDEDLKLTAYALCFNDTVAEAVKCYHTSVTNYVQIASLANELEQRGIEIN